MRAQRGRLVLVLVRWSAECVLCALCLRVLPLSRQSRRCCLKASRLQRCARACACASSNVRQPSAFRAGHGLPLERLATRACMTEPRARAQLCWLRSESALRALQDAYAAELPMLMQMVQSSIQLPAYQSLEWRLQVQAGGRYDAPHELRPSFLMRLQTRSDGTAATSAAHILQADFAMMRRLASELETALQEERSAHSRRLARRLCQ
mmetsp:Transcript_54109/g.124584  ORF Transcript_54109/g.124584 Transcript_54109/m.124584 type:complete len:208 (+) Transcript_54109:149-772(+)